MSDPMSDEWFYEVYLPQHGEGKVTTWDYVKEDITQREEMGALKYGKYLTPCTKEDMLQHAYEEALDLVVYLKTLILQREKEK
jgi:GH35 family endo-1,4-beta-xylanase